MAARELVACPLHTTQSLSWLETTQTCEQMQEIRAYKLGKRRWSYNAVELQLGEAGGRRAAAVEACFHAPGAKFADLHQDSAVGFLVQLESGIKLQAQIFLCYDQQPSGPSSSSPPSSSAACLGPALVAGTQHYAWNLVTRQHCCKGCEGRVLRPIQRFGRLGKRASSGSSQARGEAPAAALPCSGNKKDPRYMYLSLDEACTHVDASAFRLVAGIFNRQSSKLLATAVSPPIRVLANNDVPTGAARITLEARLPADWEGWSAEPSMSEAGAIDMPQAGPASRNRRSTAQPPRRRLMLSGHMPSPMASARPSSCVAGTPGQEGEALSPLPASPLPTNVTPTPSQVDSQPPLLRTSSMPPWLGQERNDQAGCGQQKPSEEPWQQAFPYSNPLPHHASVAREWQLSLRSQPPCEPVAYSSDGSSWMDVLPTPVRRRRRLAEQSSPRAAEGWFAPAHPISEEECTAKLPAAPEGWVDAASVQLASSDAAEVLEAQRQLRLLRQLKAAVLRGGGKADINTEDSRDALALAFPSSAADLRQSTAGDGAATALQMCVDGTMGITAQEAMSDGPAATPVSPDAVSPDAVITFGCGLVPSHSLLCSVDSLCTEGSTAGITLEDNLGLPLLEGSAELEQLEQLHLMLPQKPAIGIGMLDIDSLFMEALVHP